MLHVAPTLFSIMFSAMLSYALGVCKTGIDIRYKKDAKLSNPKRLQPVTKVRDYNLTLSSWKMQSEMAKFSAACDNFGLPICIKKIEVM